MYSRHTISIQVSDKDRIESILRKLSPEFQDVSASPVRDEEEEVVGYELTGFFPDQVIEFLDNPKATTKRLKEAGDSESESKNTAFLKRLVKKAGAKKEKLAKRERRERRVGSRRVESVTPQV